MQDERKTPIEKDNDLIAEKETEGEAEHIDNEAATDFQIEEFEDSVDAYTDEVEHQIAIDEDMEEDFEQFESIVENIKEKKNKKKKKKGGCLSSFIYVTVVCLISLLLAGGFLYCANDVFAIVKPDEKVDIYIEKNSSTQEIAKVLKENGVIKSELLYRFYSWISKSDGKYQYGAYTLNKNYDYSRIAYELKKIAPKKDEVQITFKEGITANEIIDELVKKVKCDREKLFDVMNNGRFGYSFADDLPKNENRYIKLEGYLFPDTYNFFVGESEYTAVKRLLENFNNKWTNEFQKRADELGLTVDEVINIASMIQKEAKFKEDFPLVSSVFHNRLNNPSVYPYLQMDSTRDYCNDFIMPYILTGDRERYNAFYNTYKCKGLPAGPISNPGVEAIRAALYPEETDYYYFVSDKYGKNYYGKTLLEHNKNIQKAESVK